MFVLTQDSDQKDIDAVNEYLRRSREARYTPEQLAEMERAVRELEKREGGRK